MNAALSDHATAAPISVHRTGESSADPRVVAPTLLVSVRDAAEAVAALSAGCRLLDAKDPSRGSLGFAGLAALSDIVAAARGATGAVNMTTLSDTTLSAALGEVAEWCGRAAVPLPREIRYAKLGLAGLRDAPTWRCDWRTVRDRFDAARGDVFHCDGSHVEMAPGESASPTRGSLAWIAVAYADADAASAPDPEDVLDAAIESGCAGLLIDTWDKRSGTVFDLLDSPRLRELIGSAGQAGLVTALAGRLRVDQIARAVSLRPTIVAVRSAACRGGNRAGSIDAEAVRELLQQLSGGQ